MAGKGNGDIYIKAAVGLGAVVAGGYVVYTVANSFTQGSGGNCSDPNSACGQALAPYQQELQSCANQYSSYMQQYATADSAAGTAMTSAQLSVLSQLESCMNTAAAGQASVAKNFNQSVEAIVGSQVGTAIEVAVGLVGIAVAVRVLTGSGAAAVIRNAVVQALAEAGQISSSAASLISEQLGSLGSVSVTADSIELADWASESFISAAVADSLASSDSAVLDSSIAAVQTALADIGAAGYPQNTWGPAPAYVLTSYPPYDPDWFGYSPDAWDSSPDPAPSYPPPPLTPYDPNQFGYSANVYPITKVGGTDINGATPDADCGCNGQGQLQFGRGALWMLKKK